MLLWRLYHFELIFIISFAHGSVPTHSLELHVLLSYLFHLLITWVAACTPVGAKGKKSNIPSAHSLNFLPQTPGNYEQTDVKVGVSLKVDGRHR